MPRYIIHKDGVFNVFSTIVDACIYHPMHREQIEQWLAEQAATSEIARAQVMERALQKGTSSTMYDSLEETVALNRAGPNETCIPFDEFVALFLTLPKE